MENPFEIHENRLISIENKLDNLIGKIENPNSKDPIWMTSKQLTQYVGVSVSTVTKLRISKIPYYKLGGKIYFKKKKLMNGLKKQDIKVVENI